MSSNRVIDSQRPVWKEQWCARKDAVESSGGREDQFWANGILEPLPPPSRPNRRAHSSHHADHEQSHPAPSPISHPSTSQHTAHPAINRRIVLPTSSRRKVVSSSTLLSRKKSHLGRVPTPHALVSNRAQSRMTRSAGPYSSSRNNSGIFRSSRTAESSPHCIRWNQPTGQLGSSSNYEHRLPFDQPTLSSRRSSPHIPPMTTSYQTRTHLDVGGNMSPSLNANGYLSSLPILPQQASPLPFLDYSIPSASFHDSEKMYGTSSHMGGSGQLDPLFDTMDGFWPYDSSTLQQNNLSLLWSGDGAYQQQEQEQLTPMDPTAMLFPVPPVTSDSVPTPRDTRYHALPFDQVPQPSPEPITTSSMNELQASDFMGQIYRTPDGIQATNHLTDFHFPHPSFDDVSLDSFPNIVQDEDGLLHLEGQTGASTYHL